MTTDLHSLVFLILMFPIDKPSLKVQGLGWHLHHLHITAWAGSLASLELISATLKSQEYCKKNTRVSEKCYCSAGTSASTRYGQSLEAALWELPLLAAITAEKLNSGWNTLQRIHGSWFFRYPDWALAEAHRSLHLARVFVPCPAGHGRDVQPIAGIWKHAWLLQLRWSLWGHIGVKRCDWGVPTPWQVPAALFHVRQLSSPWLTVSSATHKDFLNSSFYGWLRQQELSLTVIHAQLPL